MKHPFPVSNPKLELSRASAGSGKTYTLAKKFIWYFITIRDDAGKRRLRTPAEMKDGLKRILAITFTNKATNEMQMRIVDRLFDIAYRKPQYKTGADGKRRIQKPDYLEEFTSELEVEPQQVAEACRTGLEILLQDYSDFRVSTIDSFFQMILRTFAYESDLNDSYQVELDSNYLSRIAVDAMIENVDSKSSEADIQFWLKVLMDRDSKGWQLFERKESTGNGENTYTGLIKSVLHLETEDYKLIRDDLEKYFKSEPDLRRLYNELNDKYDTPLKVAFKKFREAYANFYQTLPGEMQLVTNARAHAGKLSQYSTRIANMPDESYASKKAVVELHDKIKPEYLRSRSVLPYFSDFPGDIDAAERALSLAEAEYQTWYEIFTAPEYQQWMIYKANMPYLALFGEIVRRRMEYLEDANAIELGETNMILRKIIDDNDTPFVYERLGTVLNHFLIDEFQDTSRMQWENLRPLLLSCLDRDDSLIIGDAKQSIYRFRNADPELITTEVPTKLSRFIPEEDTHENRNTNFRSSREVVQFNNSFFEFLAKRIDKGMELEPSPETRMKYTPLYENVVQKIARDDEPGYVEVHLKYTPKGKKKKGEGAEEPSETAGSGSPLAYLPELVKSILARGYSQKDICILVSTNNEGSQVINEFVAYNMYCADASEQIRFVSEASLKVANSRAVKLIVGVLENMVRGIDPNINEEEERGTKGTADWKEIQAGFKFYAMNTPGKPLDKLLNEFIESRPDMGAISEMLSSMQSLAIPAIVETVIATFVPDEMRREDAVFIAAFQDLVLEYCQRNPTDIGSFVEWWERASASATITSPENTDAVNVMTIHKSKGLEFECVILPFANFDFAFEPGSNAYKKEWRWVKPELIEHQEISLPPYVPITTMPDLAESTHKNVYFDYLDKVRMDAINSAYVAFTRAVRELYIFSISSKKENLPPKSGAAEAPAVEKLDQISRYLFDFMMNKAPVTAEPDPEHVDISRVVNMEEKKEDNETAESSIITYAFSYGRKIEDIVEWRREQEQKKKEEKKAKGEEPVIDDVITLKPELITIEDYSSTLPELNKLKYREEPAQVLEEDLDEDSDPRSEGNVKHAILESVKVPEDLPAAVRRAVLAGLISRKGAQKLEEDLAEKLARPDVRGWFDGSARVINERALIQRNKGMRRPDRLLLYPDGRVVVVDYKFGKIDKSGAHKRQVRNYMDLLRRSGQYADVTGYLWYLNENHIEQVIS